MNLDSVIGTFIAESQELLQQMEDALLQIEHAPDDAERINAIFRAAHTIKGSAGLFGFDSIVAFTHVAESVLDRVRAGDVRFNGDLIALMLNVGDHLAGLISQLASGHDLSDLPETTRATEAALTRELSHYLEPQPANTPRAAAAPDARTPVAGAGHWHLSLRFGVDTLRNGMDPLAFLRYLGTLGSILHVEPVLDHLPSLEALDPESCYLGLEVAFESQADQSAIEGAFEFVREEGSIRILPPQAPLSAFRELIAERAAEGSAQVERLVRCGSLAADAFEQAAQHTDSAHETATTRAADTPERTAKDNSRTSKDANLIRVDADKLDQLINLVGELIIAGANTRMLAQRSNLADMCESAETLSRLVEEVRDSALTLRMVQIGATFNRFQRVVRDTAKQLGKDNITSNAIAPGNVTSDAGKMLVPDDSPFIQFLQMSCALRPRGEPDELVGTALLLGSAVEAGRGRAPRSGCGCSCPRCMGMRWARRWRLWLCKPSARAEGMPASAAASWSWTTKSPTASCWCNCSNPWALSCARRPAATMRWTCWPRATGRMRSSWTWPCRALMDGRRCGACGRCGWTCNVPSSPPMPSTRRWTTTWTSAPKTSSSSPCATASCWTGWSAAWACNGCTTRPRWPRPCPRCRALAPRRRPWPTPMPQPWRRWPRWWRWATTAAFSTPWTTSNAASLRTALL